MSPWYFTGVSCPHLHSIDSRGRSVMPMYHQYQPLTRRGNNDVGSGFNDDPLWLVLSVLWIVPVWLGLAALSATVKADPPGGTDP